MAVININAQQVPTTNGKAEPVQKSKSGVVTKLLFWLGFIAFLSTSIPHVAWVYHTYEQGEAATLNFFFTSVDTWWFLSYMVAIGIDVLIAWLSYVQAVGESKTDGRVTWTFIIILSAMSWYCNYLYAMGHDPVKQVDLWSIQILGGVTTTGYVTPIIVSAVPVFVVAYTFMLSMLGTSKEVTLEDLQEKAANLEAINVQKELINKAKRNALVTNITGVVDSAREVVRSVTVVGASTDEQGPLAPLQKQIEAPVQEPATPVQATPVQATPVQDATVFTVLDLTPDSTTTTITTEKLTVPVGAGVDTQTPVHKPAKKYTPKLKVNKQAV